MACDVVPLKAVLIEVVEDGEACLVVTLLAKLSVVGLPNSATHATVRPPRPGRFMLKRKKERTNEQMCTHKRGQVNNFVTFLSTMIFCFLESTRAQNHPFTLVGW